MSNRLYKNYVNGRFMDNKTGERFPVVNPATGEEIYQVEVAHKSNGVRVKLNFLILTMILSIILNGSPCLDEKLPRCKTQKNLQPEQPRDCENCEFLCNAAGG